MTLAARFFPLIPAQAGIQFWVPAFAGTSGGRAGTSGGRGVAARAPSTTPLRGVVPLPHLRGGGWERT